ncbi:MAG: DNA mismatch repair protein MutS [Bacteroidia bacterium]
MDPLQVFEERQGRFRKAITEVNTRLWQVAMTRLAVFVTLAIVEVYSWSWGGGWWLLILFLGMLAFGLVVRWNVRLQDALRLQQLLLQFNEEEVRRLECKLQGFDEGKEFIDPAHPYTSDLDIFGQHSAYQLVNRARTNFGRRTVAAWLRGQFVSGETIPTPDQIRNRQAAANELAELIDWRQEFHAQGAVKDASGEDPEDLRRWLAEKSLLAQLPWLEKLPWVTVPALAVLMVLSFTGIALENAYWIVIGIHFLANQMITKRVTRIQDASTKRGRLLKSWSVMLAKIEILDAKSEEIRALQARLRTEGRPASAEIARLGSIVGNLEFRDSGIVHFIVNTLTLWDVWTLRSLDKWKREQGPHVMDWFAVIGEMEALGSIAAVRFAFPKWAQPEIGEGDFLVAGESLGHPMIPGTVRISNPIDLQGNGTVWLITGSNMSGKSTYLRTVGLNVVLALMGAPACAQRLRVACTGVITSMRTTDSLEENTSSFYAELKRLQSVIHQVRQQPRTLFLLDEVLKGTNSKDRQAGARALVQQLHSLGGSGLVSTHDIELVDMEGQIPSIHNYSFNCTVTDEGKLLFDYRLTPGQCLSMNATALMRAMGISV